MASQHFTEFTKAMEKRAQLEHLCEMRCLDIEEHQLKLQEDRLRLQQARNEAIPDDELGSGAIYIQGGQLVRNIPPSQW